MNHPFGLPFPNTYRLMIVLRELSEAGAGGMSEVGRRVQTFEALVARGCATGNGHGIPYVITDYGQDILAQLGEKVLAAPADEKDLTQRRKEAEAQNDEEDEERVAAANALNRKEQSEPPRRPEHREELNGECECPADCPYRVAIDILARSGMPEVRGLVADLTNIQKRIKSR